MKTIDIKDCHKAFGEYIKSARERNGMSQTEVADKLEVTQSYLSRIERGEREVDLALAFKLCAAIGLDMRDFINKYM